MKTFGKREKEWFSVPATNGQRKELTVSFQKNFSYHDKKTQKNSVKVPLVSLYLDC